MPPDPTDDPHFRGLFIPYDIGPNWSRIPVMAAIRLEDEILYIVRFWNGVGDPKVGVLRGMEGTTPAPHLAGTEVEYIVPTVDPEWAAVERRAGRPLRANGSWPHPWHDLVRQDWPNKGLPVSTRP